MYYDDGATHLSGSEIRICSCGQTDNGLVKFHGYDLLWFGVACAFIAVVQLYCLEGRSGLLHVVRQIMDLQGYMSTSFSDRDFTDMGYTNCWWLYI